MNNRVGANMNSSLNQTDRVERFEAAFNRIHLKLKELVKSSGDHAPYGEVLYAGRKIHNSVRYHYEILKQFGYLRNALVHQRFSENYYIAEPHEEVVKEIERICELVIRPPSALSVASQPVISYQPETPIREILKMIEKKGFSQFPIYNEKGFVGLLTEGGIAKWMSVNLVGDVLSVKGIKAKHILAYEKLHNVAFLSRECSIHDLEDAFESSFDRNEKLEAIIITQTGLKSNKPIGIVSSWDLVKIDHTTFPIASQV
jgi:predicted transcriptional regulator